MIRHWGRLTGSPLSSTVANWGRRGIVKSIQRGIITLNNVTSNTATVTAVDPNNAVLTCLGWTSAGTGTDQRLSSMAVVLTNSTTVTATVNGAEAVAHILSYELLEYVPGVIKSIQRGTVTCSAAASATATITAIDTTKAVVIWAGFTTDDGTAMQANLVYGRLVLTNATTVTFSRPGSAGVATVPFTVVEYY